MRVDHKVLADDEGSSLPFGVAALCFGLAILMSSVQMGDLVLLKERELLLADSLAWKYAGSTVLLAGGAHVDLRVAISRGEWSRATVRLAGDSKTVTATVCSPAGLCASSSARSVVQAPLP